MNTDELFVNIDNLPNLLSKEETYELLKLISNNEEAKQKLITHNIRLVLKVVFNYKGISFDKKDLVSIGIFGLIRAIDTFDFEKGFEFTTYAVKCINNEILLYFKKLKRYKKVDSLDKTVFNYRDGSETKLSDILSDDKDFVEDIENEDVNRVLRELVEELDDREREIIMMYFGFYDGKLYSQKDISEKFNITHQSISLIIKRVLRDLTKKLKKMGIVESSKLLKTKK